MQPNECHREREEFEKSAAMFVRPAAAAVAAAVKDGVLTADLVRGAATPVSTVQAADAVLERL